MPPVIWALLHAMTEPEAYAITFRRTGKTPELWIKPITDCNKVRG